MRWQKVLRLLIAVTAVAFAIVVVLAFKRRSPVPVSAAPERTDPGAVVEITGGRVGRFKFSREDIRVDCEKQLVYPDNSTKLLGVTIVSEARANANGRTFTVKAREGQVGQNETTMVLSGQVQLAASDGMTLRTEQANYDSKDGVVQASGPVEFSRGRMTGSGTGMTYDTAADVLSILDAAIVHVMPDDAGAGAVEIRSAAATFTRKEHQIRFERNVHLERASQIVDSDAVLASLTEDEKQIQQMELRGHSRIAMAKPAVGGLQGLNSRDMDLKYGADGQSLEHAVLVEDAAIVLAGDGGSAGRQIVAKTIDVALGPDGTTPVSLAARDAVQLVLPAEKTLPTRTIRSATMNAEGQPGRGLTHAAFAGAVEYAERGAGVTRTATATTLDVALKPAMAGIDEATFSHAVCFLDGATPAVPDPRQGAATPRSTCAPNGGMAATAAAGRYDLDKGVLNLTGSEPGALKPHVVNDKISVDATTIDLTFAGPKMTATGAVKSVLQPAAKTGRGNDGSAETHVPSMFKQDKPVNVIADTLDYNGAASKATYTGNAQLWQDDTSVKGASILLDGKTGDLTAGGNVATVTVRDDVDKNKKTQRVRSLATATDFHYEEAAHRATYAGTAHMNSPTGDMTASKIELYFKTSGNDLDRAEAYENVTLHDENRTTTGGRLTYTTIDERYVVTGAPVKVVDACHRETIGRTLTYLKSAETIVMDGNEQTRTQSTGNGLCQ